MWKTASLTLAFQRMPCVKRSGASRHQRLKRLISRPTIGRHAVEEFANEIEDLALGVIEDGDHVARVQDAVLNAAAWRRRRQMDAIDFDATAADCVDLDIEAVHFGPVLVGGDCFFDAAGVMP